MGLKLKKLDLESDATRLARPWQVRTMEGDVLAETFDTWDEAKKYMVTKNKFAQQRGLRVRYRLAHKIKNQPVVKI